jgi:acyl-CoA synthetase (NDP forming)
MGNPRKFSRIARHLASSKPIIVVKSGVSAYGVPPGHRVRPTKARPEAFEAMLRQAGVIRVENVHQLFDVAQLVVHQPLPKGSRVGIVTNSDALSALTADSCVSWGLEIGHGPVSVHAEATGAQFRKAVEEAFANPNVDSVIACFIPPLATPDEHVAVAVREASERAEKPCVATFLGMRGVDNGSSAVGGTGGRGQARAIPLYAMPEDAVRALAAATRYGEWRNKDKGIPVTPAGVNRRGAEALVHGILADAPEGRPLRATEVTELLGYYGISLWPSIDASTEADALEAAEQLGYPVVLKSTSPLLRHLPGLSGIRVDLANPAMLKEAFASLNERLAPVAANSFAVQRMATPGVACVVGSDEDPLFGPVVSFSVAGPPTELLDDIGYRIPPMTDVDVSELISSVKASPLLHGHRGAAPVHRAALGDLIARVSVLADDLPEVARLSLNPVNAHPGGIEVLGAEAVLQPPPRRTDPGRRSLT